MTRAPSIRCSSRAGPPRRAGRSIRRQRADRRCRGALSGSLDVASIEMSRAVRARRLREYWLRAPTPSPLLARRPAARRCMPALSNLSNRQPARPLILGSGLCLEFELLAMQTIPAGRLAAMGWRVIEPISPYHGLRALPGFYGGEPFFALARPARST
jgi:hypothetical protein